MNNEIPSDGKLLCPVTRVRQVVEKHEIVKLKRRCCTSRYVRWLCSRCDTWHRKKLK